jgi:hypothetical protein
MRRPFIWGGQNLGMALGSLLGRGADNGGQGEDMGQISVQNGQFWTHFDV